MSVAALFVDPEGPYPTLLGADRCWDVERDARKYHGTDPVVAHPPCGRWSRMARINYQRYGGEHNRPGNDGGTFAVAWNCLRRLGGVLEQPRESGALEAHGIEPPKERGWQMHTANPGLWEFDYWVCEVWQSAYGHPCHKATWLVYVGARAPFELDWRRDRSLATHQVGGGIHTGERSLPRLPDRLTHITPEPFARELIRLAEWSRGSGILVLGREFSEAP